MRYTLSRAAELAEASYTGKSHPVIGFQWADSLNEGDVEAHLLTDDTLLIVGSNSWRDYIKFNLRIQRLGKPRLNLARVTAPVSWHQGFLAYTKAVQDWVMAKGVRPSFIIGHSLGAASTQILSAGWDIPGVAFAAPRTCRTAAAQAMAPKCLCINRTDDAICNLPSSFKHLGHVRACVPRAPNRGLDHKMAHYRQVVGEGIAVRKLPRSWP